MSLLTQILIKAGLARKQTAPSARRETREGSRSHLGSLFKLADSDGVALHRKLDESTFKATRTRYAPIRSAVEERLETFVRRDVVSHLEIAREDVFMLHYIEMHAEHDGTLLDEFLDEFSPPARIEWVKRLLAAAPQSHVRVDQFLGLDKQFSQEHLEDTDPFEEELTRDAALHGYQVILHGRWERKQPAAAPDEKTRRARVAGAGIRLTIHDAAEQLAGVAVKGRHVDIDEFPAVLGSSREADVQVQGQYVSGRHCTLHQDATGQLWVEDHSKNGTWIDGEVLERDLRVPLSDSAVLTFGGQNGADHLSFPVVHVQIGARIAHAAHTPIAPSRATPIASSRTPISAAKAAIAVLAITDATGTAHKVIYELPFTIGRGSDQNYIVPDDNAGVSREHLVIESMTEAGAVTTNKAVDRNGTFAGEQALPQQFEWQFDQEIVLARKWTRASPARVVLKRAEQSA